MGKVTGEDVSKVSGGSHKSDLVANLERRRLLRKLEIREVVEHDLSENSREVDGVDSAQFQVLVCVGIAKQRLDNVLLGLLVSRYILFGSPPGAYLAVVECPRNSQVVDIRFRASCHLHFLNGADTALGMQDSDRYILLASETVNGGGTSLVAS